MVDATVRPTQPELEPLPDHTQLPDSDGTFVKNFQEHPQSILLTDSILPVLQARHPDGQYAIGQDCGIYWRITDPPERGAEAPDWFYVPNVPPMLDEKVRRSYVMWQEHVSPLIAIEFASGSGKEERDRTPLCRSNNGKAAKPGKFWIYEQVVHIPYYAIFVISTQQLEVYELIRNSYQPMQPNQQGHFEIQPLGVELGLWSGEYMDQQQTWMRWWDSKGNLLLTGREAEALALEEAVVATEAAEQATQEARREREEKEKLIAQLRALGVEPDVS